MSRSRTDEAQLSQMLQADGLPGVVVSSTRPWRDLAEETVRHLVTTKTAIYVRHGQLVRIQRKEDGSPYIETLNETTLRGLVGRAMNFVKITATGPQHIAPPDTVIKDVLTLGHWPFPPLDSIVEFPVFRPDGTLIDTPGYDPVTHLAYVPLPTLSIPQVPEHPTDEDLMRAQELIHEAIGEFPFENDASYANAIGLLLTPLIRQSLNGHVPLALLDATRPGTGKSLFAETVAMIATGRKATMMTAPYDDNEWRKRIASTLAEGATIIVIDNIKARIQSASLDSALTSFVVKERILGQSRNGVYAQRATWIATGNNIQLGGDLPRRSYWIRMDAKSAQPWTRGGFSHNLEEWIPAHRGELIAALLTLARAWFAAGKPPATLPKMGSFQPWVDTVGGILAHAWLGECPFLGNLSDLYEQSDDDAQQWAAFLHAWHELYQDQEILVATLVKDIKAGSFADGDTSLGVSGLYNALPDELDDIKKGDFKRRLGKALSARVGTQFDDSGLHLVKGGINKRSGAVYWAVADAGLQVSQVSIPQKEENFSQESLLDGSWTGGSEEQPQPKMPQVEGEQTCKPANLHGMVSPAADENGQRWQHLQLFDAVWTPRGEGMVIWNWPSRVGVRLYETQQEVFFEQEQEILAIRPLINLTSGPTAWPYNVPSLTDADLLEMGYLTRRALGYPQPDPPDLEQRE